MFTGWITNHVLTENIGIYWTCRSYLWKKISVRRKTASPEDFLMMVGQAEGTSWLLSEKAAVHYSVQLGIIEKQWQGKTILTVGWASLTLSRASLLCLHWNETCRHKSGENPRPLMYALWRYDGASLLVRRSVQVTTVCFAYNIMVNQLFQTCSVGWITAYMELAVGCTHLNDVEVGSCSRKAGQRYVCCLHLY